MSHKSSNPLMLADNTFSDVELCPPTALFAQSQDSISPASSAMTNPSLAVNYIPSKFSAIRRPSGPRRRRKNDIMRGVAAAGIPRGGGADAFKSGQARIPSGNDEDYDGMNRPLWFSGKSSTGQERTEKKLRWNIFKSLLFLSNAFFSIYTLTTLIFCLLTWFDVFHHADIIRVGNRTELIFSTLAASFGLFTSIIGWSGILLNNRGFLAVYTFFLWITFAFLVIPGYITYKRRTFDLEGKLNSEWSRALGVAGRLRIQNRLSCCGWFSPFVEATISQTCYARSVLPGCKLAYLDWQKRTLERWYTIAFGLVPLQITVLVAGLLCSNHVTYRFGKGMIPKRYQLNPSAMKVIVDKYKNEISDRYGNDIASDIIARSPGLQNYSLGLVELDNASQRHSSSPPSARNRGSMVPHNDSFGKFGRDDRNPDPFEDMGEFGRAIYRSNG